VTVAAGTGCGVAIAALVVVATLLLVVTSWPAYFLGVLRVSESTVARTQRAVARTALALLVVATGGLLFLVLRGC
jgi:hypothetical protein